MRPCIYSENEILRNQLKTYVEAVKMMDAEEQDEPTSATDDNGRQDSTASIYEKKLIQA